VYINRNKTDQTRYTFSTNQILALHFETR